MSSRDFRGYIDAALARDIAAQSETLQRWLTPTRETRVETVTVADVAEPDWRDPVDAADPGFRALKASIRASGILQPILVRPTAGGRYEVVSGMRRLKAARDTGQESVPATIRNLGDVEAIVGAWDAVVREGTTPARRRMIEDLLLVGGMAQPEISGLLATLQLAAAVEEAEEDTGAGAPPPEAAAALSAGAPEAPASEAPAAAEPVFPAEPAPAEAATAVEPAGDMETAAAGEPAPVEAAAAESALTEAPAAVEPAPEGAPLVAPAAALEPAPVEPSPSAEPDAAAEAASGLLDDAARAPLAWVPPAPAPEQAAEQEDADRAGADETAAAEVPGEETPWPAAQVPPAPWSWKGVPMAEEAAAPAAAEAPPAEEMPAPEPAERAASEATEGEPHGIAPVEPAEAPAAGEPQPASAAAMEEAALAEDPATLAPEPSAPPPTDDVASAAGASPPPAGLGSAWTLPSRPQPPRPLSMPSSFPAPRPPAPAVPEAAPLPPAATMPPAAPPEPAREAAAAFHVDSPPPAAPAFDRDGAPPASRPADDRSAPAARGVEPLELESPPRRVAPPSPIPFNIGPRVGLPPRPADLRPDAPAGPRPFEPAAPRPHDPGMRPFEQGGPIEPPRPDRFGERLPDEAARPADPGVPRHEEPDPAALRGRTATIEPAAPGYTPRILRIDLPRPEAPTVDDGPSDPVVVAPRPGQHGRRISEPPQPAGAAAPGRGAGSALVDWQLGATAGTFVFVLAVVYIILIVLLGSTTLLVPALVVALVGAAVAVLSMARARQTP